MNDNAAYIRFYKRLADAIGKARDGARGIWPDTRERVKRRNIFWDFSIMRFYNFFCALLQIKSAPVITHAVPNGKNASQRSFCECFCGRKRSKELGVCFKHPRDLCLLKHDL